MFEPFFTDKGEAGTGLGLAVVAGIIASNNGALAIQSWSDCGTIFELWWPLQSQPQRETSAPGLLPAAGSLLAGKTALVIGDNPNVASAGTDR